MFLVVLTSLITRMNCDQDEEIMTLNLAGYELGNMICIIYKYVIVYSKSENYKMLI